MIDALASYHLRINEFDQALNLWSEAPVEPAFHRQMVKGVVKARVMQALQAAKTGLVLANTMKEQADLATEMQMTGNTQAIGADAVEELAKLQTKIERFLSEM